MTPQPLGSSDDPLQAAHRRSLTWLAVAATALILAFGVPLMDLVKFSVSDDLFSYIPLIPATSLYLIWADRRNLPGTSQPARALAAIFGALGLILVGAYLWGRAAGWNPDASDYLALMTAAFLLLLTGAGCLFLGGAGMRRIAFPAAFLVFCIPLPSQLHRAIEQFLQYASADVAYGMFWLSTTPVWRQGVVFQLPAFNLAVEPECSGIHSTLVLFITSVLAAHLFLRTTWRRVLLALSVIPLALLRNGFRIFVIGQLCVHVGPQMIDSYIHRKGGPIFFSLSLVPFFLLLRFLRKSETHGAGATGLPHAIITEGSI